MQRELEDLFDRYRSCGDIAALGEVFDRTAPALVRIALHLCGNRQDAEDAVQATYLRAIEAAGSWDAARPLTPWLVGILANRARHRRTIEARRLDPERVAAPADAGDPRAQALRAELGDAVEATIGGLPAQYQPVLRLHLLDGRDPVEIAAVLARPPGTVRSQLARGLRALRALLPRGFAAGMAAAPSIAALPRMRALVLAHAGAPPLAIAGAGSLFLGGLAVQKITIGAVLAALLVLWFVCGGTTDSPSRSGADADTAPSLGVGPAPPVASAEQPPHRVALAPAEGGAETARVGMRDGAPPDATGSLRVRATWQSDRQPAASVPLFVAPERASRPAFAQWRATTGADGVARLLGLPPGRVHVRSGRAEYDPGHFVDIAAGTEATAELTLGGVTVTGVVVDAQERPVADAPILVEASGPRELTRSAVDGTFMLRGLGPEVRIGARAAGHAPSKLHRIKAHDGRIVPLRVVLPGLGGRLHCTVVDSSGSPLRDAVVSVGAGHWPARRDREALCEWRATTDGSGHAEFDGVPVGDIDVFAWAEGAAPWRGTAVIAGGAATDLTIQLPPGAVLLGQVRDQEGRPLPGYEVAVNHAASAAYRQFGPFAFQYVRTDATGAYRLDGLPAGEIVAEVSGGGDAAAKRALTAGAGEVLRWDPELDVAAGVPGRVVGPDGRGLEAIIEGTLRGRGNVPVCEVARSDGRFTLKNVAGGEAVRLEARILYSRVARFVGELPREGELVLHVAAEDLPSIRIASTVVDDEGQPVPLAMVSVVKRGEGSAPVFTTGDGGRFDAGPFPSGDYSLHVQAAGHVRLRTDWCTIAPDQAKDFGMLRLQPGCSIDVHLHSTAPLPEKSYFTILDAHGDSHDLEMRAGRGSLDHLPAGHCELLVLDHPLALARHAFHATAGKSTRLDVAVEPGVPIEIHLRGDGRTLPKLVTLDLTSADGRTLLTTTASVAGTGRVRQRGFALLPGAYRVRVAVEGRPIGEHAFTVAPAAPSCRVEVPITGG